MSPKAKNNKRKRNRLNQITQNFVKDLTNKAEKLKGLTKFCFSFFCSDQEYSQSFEDWAENSDLSDLGNKLVEFSKQPLLYWQTRKADPKSTYLAVYKKFPKEKSWLTEPNHVPDNVWWARFRLCNKLRLAGFVLPNDSESKEAYKDLDSNTFYVVFLDNDHKFYDSNK